MNTWYSIRSHHNEVVTREFFANLQLAIGSHGLAALDQIFAVKIVQILRELTQKMDGIVFRDTVSSFSHTYLPQ